ncbi:MAG: spheroidene monooxygenase [Burkholderiaceae bacterium]|nr:spheroidene monooxygenase [Burkholderiaceae bacterium]
MIAVIVLVDFKPESKWWGFTRFVLGRWPLRNIPGLSFSKILGSGHEGGFGLKPSATRQGLFCLFEQEIQADQFLRHSKVVTAYRARAREFFSCKLQAYSCKGSWSGTSIPVEGNAPASGPIAALTRASIRPSKASAFWRNSPPAELSLAKAQGCLIAVGLGEAPVLRQATFSIWESVEAMNSYARTGAHMDAIKASLGGQHFSESMFVRFRPISPQGVWKGKVFA